MSVLNDIMLPFLIGSLCVTSVTLNLVLNRLFLILGKYMQAGIPVQALITYVKDIHAEKADSAGRTERTD